MGKSTYKFQAIVGVSIFAALGTILMFFEFPILIWMPFLKVDLSDVVTIIGTFAYGPVGGILIALIKSMVHVIVTGSGVAGLIGNGAAFVGSVSLLIPFNYFWKKDQRTLAIIGGTASMTIIMSILNYLVVMPLYMNVVGMKLNMSLAQYVATGVIPFNIVKALILSAAVIIVYPRIKGHFAIK
ncbi:ECF transporter S component [Companilactobacillus nantensis]|uniref:Riboflavin transporter n=1 Tax=Companilactobacillus nantensis DSM 16982 TaxID=1423774 RepID=A0A0R1WL39_9LACO|nr:ECF transporter S component [Companilactobacillus nantensis]KRM18479.1 integral membrane protein [Companilactobacillus nantensis DSM 16982]GEO63052.1 riboflavin transporter [Companilactobacillus nantensis]